MKTFYVPTVRFEEFLKSVKSISKKFKVTGKVLRDPEVTSVEMYDHHSHSMVDVPAWRVEVDISTTELEKFTDTGMTYLGAVRKDIAVTVSTSPYARENNINITEMVSAIKSMPCDLCKKKGGNRKTIHVFIKDGEVTSYGTTCAMNQFGIDFERIISKFEKLWMQIGNCYGGDYYGIEYHSIKDWIACCMMQITEFGYVSGSKSQVEGVQSTKHLTNYAHEVIVIGHAPSEYDYQFAKDYGHKVDAFRKSFDYDAFAKYDHVGDKSGDFAYNIKAMVDLMEGDALTPNLEGYLAWMVFDFWNTTIRVKPESMVWNETHSYKAGDKFKNVVVEIVSVHEFEGYYGTTAIYTLKTEDNVKMKWFTTPKYDVGDTVKLTSGSVKELEDHAKFGKAVVVTRCRGKVV